MEIKNLCQPMDYQYLCDVFDVISESDIKRLVCGNVSEVDLQEPLQALFEKRTDVLREIRTTAYKTLTNGGKEDYWKIDFVFAVYRSFNIPVEFKYCESSKDEVLDDIKKIEAYLEHFEDVQVSGLIMFYKDRDILQDKINEIKQAYSKCKVDEFECSCDTCSAVFVYLEKQDVTCVKNMENLDDLCREQTKAKTN